MNEYEIVSMQKRQADKAQNTAVIPVLSAVDGNLLDRFVSYVDVCEKSVETYFIAVRQFIVYLQEHNIQNPTRQTVIDYRESLKEGHKPSTVQNYLTALKIFFKWTEQEGLYPNIADKVKGAKINRDSHRKGYFTSRQLQDILSQIDTSDLKGKRDCAILTVMITGGLRDVEVRRANVQDISVIGDTPVLFLQGKGRDERTDYIKLQPHTEKTIRAYLSARGKAEGTEPLFTSVSNHNAAGRMTTQSISRIAKTYMRAAGFDSDRLTAHSLRHSAGTLALLNGMSVQEAQQFLRHKNPATTLIYLHNIDRLSNACEATIEKAVFGNGRQEKATSKRAKSGQDNVAGIR